MIQSIELQVISKILTSENQLEIDTLCGYDPSYYSIFRPQIEFILNHKAKYGSVPDTFTFLSEFPDTSLVQVDEPLAFLSHEMRKNKQHIIMMETFNKIKLLSASDIEAAWSYIGNQYDRVSRLDGNRPMDIIKDAQIRADQVAEYARQSRIPTGFAEIDKLMYGGLSTVEELVVLIARTNTGKSWVCTKMMESAQKHKFPVLVYSPEMQASFLATRFDTWRGKFANSDLFRGRYSEEYKMYIQQLSQEDTSVYVVEDKDIAEGAVNVSVLKSLVKRYGIKLLMIDGLSYMEDEKKSDRDHEKYKNICAGLFQLSKEFGCAVVLTMQANRETKENKDEKGVPFPSIENAEGSDHPARIATQVFSMRQIFDKHVLDIRLEKSRNAANQKPILSYSWEVNTGRMEYLPGGDNDSEGATISNVITPSALPGIKVKEHNDSVAFDLDDDDQEVEF